MRILSTLCLILALAAGCAKSKAPVFPPSQIVSYPTGENRFVILAVEDNDMTAPEAKQAAREQAAKTTLDNGYRYFSIVSETEIQVYKTVDTDSAQPQGNLYQEAIVQKQFGRDAYSQGAPEPAGTYPAIRLVIECYKDKPSFKNSIDAQKFLNS